MLWVPARKENSGLYAKPGNRWDLPTPKPTPTRVLGHRTILGSIRPVQITQKPLILSLYYIQQILCTNILIQVNFRINFMLIFYILVRLHVPYQTLKNILLYSKSSSKLIFKVTKIKLKLKFLTCFLINQLIFFYFVCKLNV